MLDSRKSLTQWRHRESYKQDTKRSGCRVKAAAFLLSLIKSGRIFYRDHSGNGIFKNMRTEFSEKSRPAGIWKDKAQDPGI